jgi:hypothetical protein
MRLLAFLSFETPIAGINDQGQIVTMQRFIEGNPPTDQEVGQFLRNAEFVPVKERCWLWKQELADNDSIIWVGDARPENFIKNEQGIVPIDVRMWVTQD